MTEEQQSDNTLTAFLLSMDDYRMLVPNTTLIEVMSVATMIPVSKKPNWFLGKLGWHGKTVPMIAFNRMNDEDQRLGRFQHAAVVQGGNFVKELPAFAIALSQPPKMLHLTADDITAFENELGPASAAEVEVAGQRAYIPNMAYIEATIIANLT